MNIESIKNHGAMLGLKAELGARVRLLKDAFDKEEWPTCHSHGKMISDLSEELRKLNDLDKPKPAGDPSTPQVR